MTERHDDINRPFILDDELRRPADQHFSSGARSDDISPATTRTAIIAVAVTTLLGVTLFTMTGTPNRDTQVSEFAPRQTTAQSSSVPVAPGVRDVTPRHNSGEGITTGSANNRPTPPTEAASR